MNKIKIFILSILLAGYFYGCSFLETAADAVAPSQINALTNEEIPGTHVAIPAVETVAGMIPFGGVALSLFLLIMNFYERYKVKKTEAGLVATMQAIEYAGNDPNMSHQIAKLKEMLAKEHNFAKVQDMINDLLKNKVKPAV